MRLDEYYALSLVGDELCHHGVRGQAWGVQNGPPYPLNSDAKAQFRENKRVLSSGKSKSLKEKMASRHGKAQTINRSILRADTATNKLKAKAESSKNEIRKARHAYKDARRREKLALRKEEQKQRDEERRRNLEYKSMKDRAKAETSIIKSKARADKFANSQKEREAKREQLKEMTKSLNKEIRSPKDIFKERVINSGDKKMLRKYGFMLNNEEYAAAQKRINMVQDIKRGKISRTVDTVSGAISKGADVAKNVANAYNTANAIAKVVAPNSKFAAKKQINFNPTEKKSVDPADALSKLKATMEYRNTFGRDPQTGKNVKTKFDPDWWHVDYSQPMYESDGITPKTTKSGEPIFRKVKGGMRAYYPWEDD